MVEVEGRGDERKDEKGKEDNECKRRAEKGVGVVVLREVATVEFDFSSRSRRASLSCVQGNGGM